MLYEGGASLSGELKESTQATTRRPITSNSFCFTRSTVGALIVNSQLGESAVPEYEIHRLRCEDVEVSTPQQPVPPESSSHTTNPPKQVIRISPLAYLGCAFLLFAVSFPIFGWPAAFGWLVIAPIVAVAWVARVRTTVTPDGLEVRRLFGGRSLAWSEITGFRFPGRGWARATLTDGGEVTLPAVTFDRLPDIAQASGGRITDPYAAAAAADEAAHHADTESNLEQPVKNRPDTDGE